MSGISIAVLSVTVIGVVCAVMLSIAAKFMAVKVDERIPVVRDCLPGANCGACGFAGCDGYAKALVEEDAQTTLCIPGGQDTVARISEALGKKAEAVEKKIAFVSCAGDCNVTENKMDYRGIDSCSAAKLLFGGIGKCTFGCLGFGECAVVCPQDAICIENGIAHVDERRCIGCGLCVKACPNHIISIIPASAATRVVCSNKEKGASVKKNCKVGCIGCGLCVKKCAAEAIILKDNLAIIDHEKCVDCGACKAACPSKCIH